MVVNIVAAALQISAVYALINFGFVYLYRTTGVVSFAQGQIAMLGAYVAVACATALGTGLGLVASFLAVGLGGGLSYYLVFRLLHGKSEMVKVIATFMVGLVLIQVTGLIWGITPRQLPFSLGSMLHFGGGQLPVVTIIDAVGAVACILGADWMLRRTSIGLKMLALADNETLSQYRGLPFRKLTALAWAIACVSALAGALVYVQSASINSTMWTIGFDAFPAAVIGGLDSITGALVGSLFIGVVGTVAAYFFSGTIGEIVIYGVMVLSLMVFPYGILGRKRAVRL